MLARRSPPTEPQPPKKKPPAKEPVSPKEKTNLKDDWKQIKRLILLARPYSNLLFWGLLTTIFSSGLSLVFPALFGRLIDASFLQSATTTLLDRTVLLLLGVFALASLFTAAQSFLLNKVGVSVVADLRRKLFDHMMSLSARFFVNQKTGDLGSRLNNDTSTISQVVSGTLATAISQVIGLVGAGILMVLTSPRLSLMTAIIIPAIIVIAIVIGSRFKEVGRQMQDAKAEATAGAEEAISGIRVVHSFTAEPLEIQRYFGGVQNIFGFGIRHARLTATMGGVMSFLSFGSLALILWYGGRLVMQSEMTPGSLVSFLFYAFQAGGTVAGMTGIYAQIQQALGASGRIFELLDEKSDLTEPLIPVAMQSLRGQVRFDNVSFEYEIEAETKKTDQAASQTEESTTNTTTKRQPQPILQGINLNIPAGQVLALVGPSGAGKSTLASLIPRFWDVTSGRICIDSVDIREYALSDLRANVGMVPQETLLFSGSILENILYGRPEANQAEVEEATRAANAHGFISKLAEGYHTLVGERGVKLSGGQRQRIAIARAILKDPRILILDEATSSLDNESEALVQSALERLMIGRTTLIIAHRLSTIRNADRIVVLQEGKIIEDGSHDQLMSIRGTYYDLYQTQFRPSEESLELLKRLQDSGNV